MPRRKTIPTAARPKAPKPKRSKTNAAIPAGKPVNRNGQLVRLLTLLRELHLARLGVQMRHLVEALSVDRRTIERDFSALRELGYELVRASSDRIGSEDALSSLCVVAFSSREPASTSLENAPGNRTRSTASTATASPTGQRTHRASPT